MKNTQSQKNNTRWVEKKLGEAVTFFNGKAHENDISDNGKYILVNSKFVSTNGLIAKHADTCFSPLKKGDVAMVMSDVPNGKAIAKCFLVNEDNKYTLNQRIGGFRSNEINSSFLYFLLNRNRYFLTFDDGVNQTNLRKDDILECPLYYPPLSEQNRIVSVLETWDKAIEKLKKKIEAKKQIKKGLMQDLLTGKKRLRRFSKKWETKTISEICNKENSDVSVNTLDFNSGKYPVYGASGFIKNIDFFTQNKPYISIVKDGAGVGRLTLHKEKTSVLGTLNILHANNNNNLNFLYFLMHTIDFKKYITGSTIPHIYYKDYKKHKVLIPELKEQIEIAKIISTADQEIVVSENKLKLLKEQKRYLLNNLITGKIRTPETLSRKLIK